MRRIIQSEYFYPLVIFSICVWRMFVPQLPANDGLGWDGYRYYSITLDGIHSNVLDSYLVFRIFPCLLIHSILKILSITIDPPHVILAFKIMNSVLIGLSALMVKRIFSYYKLSDISQLIGFIIIFMNYGLLNFTFYYPVMTDTSTYFLSIALFYFFVRGELLNIFLVGLIGAFTWPVLFAMALALLLFPNKKIEFVPVSKWIELTLCTISLAYGMTMGWYIIFEKAEKAYLPYTLPISHEMIWVSFLCLGLYFFFIPMLLRNKTFFNIKYYRSQITGNRIFAIIAIVIMVFIIRGTIPAIPSEHLTLYHQLKTHLVYAFQRPFMTQVSHFNYFGCGLLLVIIFWRRFAAFVSTFGLGATAILLFNLVFFSMKAESRTQVHIFPWLLILISLYIGQYKFSKFFYTLIIIINVIVAKLWLFFDYNYSDNPSLPDGTIGFPDQWFFMNLGIWMTEHVWFWGLIITAICLSLLILSLYNIKFGRRALLFYRKYEPVHHD